MDASSRTLIDETSIRYDGWRIVVVCFLLATFGWGLGFYGQSVYVAELHRLRGWPASLISSGTTFFYLFGAGLVVFVSEAIKAFGPRNCLIAGMLAMAAAAVAIGQVARTLAALCGQRRARVRLGRHQPRHHHQYARPVVRPKARHGDQPGAERRKLRRHRRRAVAGGGHRLFRFLRRDDRRRDRDDRADGAGDPDLRRPSAGACQVGPGGRRMRRRRRRSARGHFATSASSRCRLRSRWCCSRRSASSFT